MKKKKVASEELQDEEMFSLKDFCKLCLSKWKWFLLSLIVLLALGVLYIARKEPVYSRSMEILVKDQDAGGGIADISSAFSSLGLVSSNTKVNNELISLTSPAVMMEVVKRLDLTMNYNLKKGFHPNTLYGSTTPINVVFADVEENLGAGFTILLHTDGTYEIYKMWRAAGEGIEKFENRIIGTAGAFPIKSPVGNILIIPNKNFAGPQTEDMEIVVTKSGYLPTVEAYVAKLKGDLSDLDADVINLSIDDVVVARADDILNNIIDVYNQRWIEDKNRMSVATSQFISERLAVIEKELGQVDNDISEFKSEHQVPDIAETAKGYLSQDFKLTEEILKINNQLAMTKYLKDYVNNPANEYKILPMNTGTENMVLEQQIGTYNQLLLQRDNLMENASEENPLVKDINKQVQGSREAIMRSVDSQIANLNNMLKNMDQAQAETKQELASSPKQAKVLLSVERKQLVMQELYLFLLQKREENELSQTFTADNTRIITPPYGPYKPISPKKKLIMIIAFIMGLAIPAAFIFISESSNTRIRSRKDIEDVSIPFAGEIPFIGKKKKLRRFFRTKKGRQKDIDKPKIVVMESKRDIPNEAFRVVRSNVEFMLDKTKKSNVIAMTSFNPGSGKSFVAFNLGASFALKGKKVLIVDGDLRHGSISMYVNSPKKGLSTYLSSKTDDWKDLVCSVKDNANLSILPIGHKPPNPAELLDNGRLKTLLDQAREDYDIILIDCPPVNIVVDTQIINVFADRTIFVIRAALLEKTAVPEIQAMYDEGKLRNMSLLLNGTSTEFSSYHTYGNYEAFDK